MRITVGAWFPTKWSVAKGETSASLYCKLNLRLFSAPCCCSPSCNLGFWIFHPLRVSLSTALSKVPPNGDAR